MGAHTQEPFSPACPQLCMHSCMCTPTNLCTCAKPHVLNTHTCLHTRTCTCTQPTGACVQAHTHTPAHAHTAMHALTLVYNTHTVHTRRSLHHTGEHRPPCPERRHRAARSRLAAQARTLRPSPPARTVRRRAASTSIMPRSRLWQSGGMKCGMWNTPRFTFSSSCRRLSSSKGSAPCRQGTGSPRGRGQGAGGGAETQGGGAGTGPGGLTTKSANRITPQLHTSALRPSYFSPCGGRCGWLRRERGAQAEGLRTARAGVGCGPWDGQGLMRAVTTYPDHLGAGVVGGPGGKSSGQGVGSGLPARAARTSGWPQAHSRRTRKEGRLPAARHTSPGKETPLRDPQADQ